MEYVNMAPSSNSRVEELVDVLTAISVVSKRLAGKIANLNAHDTEGVDKNYEQDE